MRAACTREVHVPNDVHEITQAVLKEQVSAEIRELFPAKAVCRITGASLDTAKSWQAGRRFPSHDNLKRLEPYLESVRRYMMHEFPHSLAAAHPESQQAFAEAFRQFMQSRGGA